MIPPQQQNPDGSWTDAKPLPAMGWKGLAEVRLRRRGWTRLANLFAWWDERGLG